MLLLALAAACAGATLWVVPPRKVAARGKGPTGAPAQVTLTGVREFLAARFGIGARLGQSRVRGQRDEAALIGAALISVAARLRAGQSPAAAWAGAIDSVPRGRARDLRALADGGAALSQSPLPALQAAGAATRLAEELGADLAGVLEACAEGIEESTRAHADRDAAFAAPRATARVLLSLPLLGLAGGAMMGARPWEFFTSTWWGLLLVITGGGFLLAGRWWIQILLERARRAGGTPP